MKKNKAFEEVRKEFNEKVQTISTKNYNKNNIKEANNDYDLFVTGSDQVWNVKLNYDDENYFLVSNGIQEIRENGFGRENIPAMMAAVVVISLPLIVLFLLFRKKVMEGVSRGGTKG